MPLLRAAGHDVVGTTRSADKAAGVAALGAEPVVVDVFDAAALMRAVQAAAPQLVMHQLTDLPFAPARRGYDAGLERNARLRIDGTRNLVAAAKAAGVRRLIAQSIAFVYAPGDGAARRKRSARSRRDRRAQAHGGRRGGAGRCDAGNAGRHRAALRLALRSRHMVRARKARRAGLCMSMPRRTPRCSRSPRRSAASTTSPKTTARFRARRPSANSASMQGFESSLERLAQKPRALQPVAPGMLHRLGDADTRAGDDVRLCPRARAIRTARGRAASRCGGG